MRLLKVTLAILLLSCTPVIASDQNRPSRGARADVLDIEHVDSYVGDVVIRTVGSRIYVMVDTFKEGRGDGLVDRWFTLETAQPMDDPIFAHLPVAQINHWAGALRIISHDQRLIFDLTVPEHERAAPVPEQYRATRIAGIGLSHTAGPTEIRIASEVSRGGVTTLCDECGPIDLDPGGGGTGGTNCDAGGVGATSCSAGTGTYSCSVACAAGYYPCCNVVVGGVSCKCIKK